MSQTKEGCQSEDKNQDKKRDFQVLQWSESRKVVENLDGTLVDLRKYGFTVITSLLAATSVIYQVLPSGETITPSVKFAIILANLGLIAALYAVDCFYQTIQRAAAHKAKILEKSLNDNLGLTTMIGMEYNIIQDWFFIELVYSCFAAVSAMLGYAALTEDNLLRLLVPFVGVLVIVLIFVLNKWTSLADQELKDELRVLTEKEEDQKKERLSREKEKLPSLVSKCVDWARNNNLKQLTPADVDAFTMEEEVELLEETKRAMHAIANVKLKSGK